MTTDLLGIALTLFCINAKDSSTGKAYCWMHQKRYTLIISLEVGSVEALWYELGMSDCKGVASMCNGCKPLGCRSTAVQLDPDDKLYTQQNDDKAGNHLYI